MALLSKVTVVVKPGPQLETPAPMTGDPLEVFENDEFLDPPDIINGAVTAFFNILNPQSFEPFPETNDPSPPPTIFRSVNYHLSEERSNRRVNRIAKPASIAFETDVILYRGTDGVVGMTRPDDSGGVSAVIPNVINGRSQYIADFLTTNYQDGSMWYNNVAGTLENQLNSELSGTGPVKIAHAWVMCGIAYVILTDGAIQKSTDAFTGDITDHARIAPVDAIKRIHPGIVFASNVTHFD